MRKLLRAMRNALQLPADIGKLILIYMPGPSGILLRRRYYRTRLKRCGENFTVLPGVHLVGLDRIEVGDNVMIRENAIIRTSRPGRGPGDRRSIRVIPSRSGPPPGDVILSDNARVAFGALILGQGGVYIGRNCGIGPGAIVLSESFHHKGKDPGIIYKYCEGAPEHEQSVVQGTVRLEDGAGMASHAVLLPGSRLERNAWLAPGSIVRVGGVIREGWVAKGDPAAPVFDRMAGAEADDPAS